MLSKQDVKDYMCEAGQHYGGHGHETSWRQRYQYMGARIVRLNEYIGYDSRSCGETIM